MDKVLEMKNIEYTVPNPDKESSKLMVLKAIHDLSDIGLNTVIDSINISCNKLVDSRPSTIDGNKPFDNSIVINADTTKCIAINGKTPKTIIEFTSYLNSIALIDPLMTKSMYDIFRKEFTNLYYEAFFNEGVQTWSFDTNEINDILDYKFIRFRIVSKKINETFYWRLVDINCGAPSEESWMQLLEGYSPEKIEEPKQGGMKEDIITFLEMYKNYYPIMDASTYSTFSVGFKRIFNEHVDEEDQYEKITFKNINNILKMYKIPYILQKDHGSTFIKKCE